MTCKFSRTKFLSQKEKILFVSSIGKDQKKALIHESKSGTSDMKNKTQQQFSGSKYSWVRIHVNKHFHPQTSNQKNTKPQMRESKFK